MNMTRLNGYVQEGLIVDESITVRTWLCDTSVTEHM
jgi:hypothetical protein